MSLLLYANKRYYLARITALQVNLGPDRLSAAQQDFEFYEHELDTIANVQQIKQKWHRNRGTIFVIEIHWHAVCSVVVDCDI